MRQSREENAQALQSRAQQLARHGVLRAELVVEYGQAHTVGEDRLRQVRRSWYYVRRTTTAQRTTASPSARLKVAQPMDGSGHS